MAYLGMGDVAASDFVTRSGVCKPTNFQTLEKFKELQRQLNRVAQAKGLSKIAVDGDIGPGTVALTNSALATSGTCASIATAAESLAASAKVIANTAGVPSSVASPKPTIPPSIINAATGAVTPQPAGASVMDAFQNLGTTGMIVAAAVLGGGAYILLGKKRRRK